MPIQNTLTGEVMPTTTYIKRCELEDHFSEARGTLREWSANQIEQEYYNLFLHNESFDEVEEE